MSGVTGSARLDKNDLIAAARKLWGKETARHKNEWRFGSKGSKSIRLDDLVWFDHEAGEGGGIVDLCEQAGINGACHKGAGTKADAIQETWVPDPDPPAPAPINLLTCDHLFVYRCAAGNETHYVKRFERPRKFLPLTWGALNGVTGWHLKAPKPPLSLYKLEDLHDLDPELVLLVEGEKAADAANHKISVEQLPWLAMSWYGGAGRAAHADVSVLTGRRVVIWPDADEAGLRARNMLLEMIDGATALDVSGLAQGFDAADLRSEEKIGEWVKARMKAPEPDQNAKTSKPPPQPPGTPPPSTWPPEPIADWDMTPVPEIEWAVKDLIPLKQVALFSGEGASGKSTLGLHLCIATALGQTWLNFFPEKGPAFFFDAEDDRDIIRWRGDKICKLYNTNFTELAAAGLHIWSFAGKDALFTSADKNKGIIRPTPLYNFFLAQAQKTKPKIIVIASSANIFSGNENDRPQVTYFVNLLKAIAIAAEGSVILISHPSLQGNNSGTGLSGSTQWHNAVRARLVLHNGEGELRELEFQKNQYGKLAEKIVIEWNVDAKTFLVKPGMSNLEQEARKAKADDTFLTILACYNSAGRYVCDRPKARNYAPRTFATDQNAHGAKLKKEDLEAAMERLFSKGTIRLEPYGSPSDNTARIVLV